MGPDEMRQRFGELSVLRLGDLDAHLAWTAGELAQHQTSALRATLRHAADNAPGWRQRLDSIDIDTATPADLSVVPPLTKSDLMADWDRLV